jgi:hypothetical protein
MNGSVLDMTGSGKKRALYGRICRLMYNIRKRRRLRNTHWPLPVRSRRAFRNEDRTHKKRMDQIRPKQCSANAQTEALGDVKLEVPAWSGWSCVACRCLHLSAHSATKEAQSPANHLGPHTSSNQPSEVPCDCICACNSPQPGDKET